MSAYSSRNVRLDRWRLAIAITVVVSFSGNQGHANEPVQQPAKSQSDYGLYFDTSSGNYFSNSEPLFSIRPVKDTKHIDRIEYSVNDSPFEVYKGHIKFKNEGLHTIRFRAVDPVLNWSPIQTFRVFVDLKAPSIVTGWEGPIHKEKDQVFVHSTSKLRMSGEDGLSGLAKILVKDLPDAMDAATLSGPLQFKNHGDYEIRYSAADNVGNKEEWKSLKFSVDTNPPVSTAKINGQYFDKEQKVYINVGSTVTLTAADENSGVQHLEYSMNGKLPVKYSGPISFSEAIVQMKYRATDNVGNEETWKTLTLHQDTKPPMITVIRNGQFVLTEGKVYAKPGFSIKSAVHDDQSGLEQYLVSRNDQKFEENKEGGDFVFSEPGTFQFQIKASDKVGNASEVAPMTVVIDEKPPVSKLKGRQNLVSVGDYFLSGIPNTLEITGEDAGVGLKQIEFSYDGKTFVPLKGPIDLATWSTPRQTLYYRSVDALGNYEQPNTITIEISTNGPRVELFVENSGLPQVPLSEFGAPVKAKKPTVEKAKPGQAGILPLKRKISSDEEMPEL